MTPRQVQLVQASWEKAGTVPEAVGLLFYGKLFELDPGLRAMFIGDIEAQGRKLVTMISFVVKGLQRLETIVPGVQALGRRHAGYGVEDRHYSTVAIALLWTLAQALDGEFTDEVREAWATAYGILANTMRDSMRLAA